MLYIERVIKLLDDEYFNLFEKHLQRIGAETPLKLVRAIDRGILTEQSSGELCETVYGDASEKNKKKFFQLAHHSFRLTSFLSKNYPNYLLKRINTIQSELNEGRREIAERNLQLSLELAEKIEDHNSLIVLLGILAQKTYLEETYHASLKHREHLLRVLENEKAKHDIYKYLTEKFSAKKKPLKTKELSEITSFFESYESSDSFVVKVLCKYGYCYAVYFLRRGEFYSEKFFAYILEIEESLRKYNFIVFPFMEDLSYKISYMKLRYLLHKVDMNLVMTEAQDLLKKAEEVLFWNSYMNSPELFSLAIQTSFYSTRFLHSYKENHLEEIPEDVKEHLGELKRKCRQLLDKIEWDENSILKHISLKTAHAMLLLLGDQKEIKEAVVSVEGTLVEYQQIAFHTQQDSLFLILIIGYFCLKDYPNVVQSYKRFKKVSEGKVVDSENNLTIHGFYYASQWVFTQRKQYAKKFEAIFNQASTPNLKPTRKMLADLAKFAQMDIAVDVQE